MSDRIRFIETYVATYLANCKSIGSNTTSNKPPIEDALYEASRAWDALAEYRNNAIRSGVLGF